MSWHAGCYRKRAGDKFPRFVFGNATRRGNNIILPAEVVPKHWKEDYDYGRLGDAYMCPFQCDICHFRNLKRRDPQGSNVQDVRLLVAIRRANLDAFWGRASSTVEGNQRVLKRLIEIGKGEYGLKNFLPPMGPHPVEDLWGMGLAVTLLGKSLDKGRHSLHVQFQTVRKTRAAFSNLLWGASVHTLTMGVMARDVMKTFLTDNPAYSLWFERFANGMHSRMGDDIRQNIGITRKQMKHLLARVDTDFLEWEGDVDKARFFCRAGLFFISAYLGSLRGEEVPRIVRKEFIDLNKESLVHPETPHCVLPLFGRFKGDRNVASCYVFRIVTKFRSGLDMQRWVKRSMDLESEKRAFYLFSDVQGKQEAKRIYL